MAGGDNEIPDGGKVESLPAPKSGSGRKSPKTGRAMCAVPDCPRMSDGKRSDYMCRGHYVEIMGAKATAKGAARKKAKKARAKDDEEEEVEQESVQSTDADHYGDEEDEDDDDASSLRSPKRKSSPASAAADANEEAEEDGTGGGRRRTRRNRKPSAKVAAAVQQVEVERKGRSSKRKAADKGGGRIDYAFLQYGDDDARYRGSSATGGGSKKPKIAPTRARTLYQPPPLRRPTSNSPEPPYLFRQGPLPPPSPPVEPRSGPPGFPLPLAARAPPAQAMIGGGQQLQQQSSTSRLPVRAHPYGTHGGVPTEVAGVYAPMIRLRVQRDADASAVLPLPPRTVGGPRDQIEKVKQCNCKKSNCLKLYCECFASAIHCSSLCNCAKCQNNENSAENIRERSKVVVGMLERNPNAFRPRPLAMAGAAATAAAGAGSPDASKKMTTPLSTKGCNCRKSFCLKKYCECFHAAVYCNPSSCRCQDCQNFPGNEQREKLIKKRQKQAEKSAQAAASQYSHRRIGGMMAAMGRAGGSTGVGVGGRGEGGEADEFGEVAAAGAAGVAGGMAEGDGAAAAALAAGAAAAGVDVFLPPSSYAVPMKIGHGIEVPGLSFGTSGTKTSSKDGAAKKAALAAAAKGKTTGPKYSGGEQRVETEYERNTRLAADNLAAKLVKVEALVEEEKKDKQKTRFGSGAEAIAATGAAVRSWDDVVQASSTQLQQQKKSKTSVFISTHMSVPSTSETLAQRRAKDLDAGETLRFVKSGLNRIKMATDRAKERAVKFMDDEEQKQEVTFPNDGDAAMDDANDPELNALLCTESMPRSKSTQELVQGKELSDAERELFILAAQDAALMHELAKVIREKALEMGAERIKRAAEAPGKARSVAEAIVKANNR